MVPSFKYVGPHDAVDLQGYGVVERDGIAENVNPDVAAGLDGQADWELLPVLKKKD